MSQSATAERPNTVSIKDAGACAKIVSIEIPAETVSAKLSDSIAMLGNEAQLVMALRNLLTNAIAYSPAGTRVVVAARCADKAVEIGVTDQGIGIPEGEQARIFERFYRVDPARSRITGGTGLGLAIVKHVCVNHGGECTVWSVEGEGSTLTLRLPLAPAGTIEGDTPP